MLQTVNAKGSLVERKQAAKMLNVSTRTLDRYLRKNKLSSLKKNHRIFLKKNEIDAFINEYKVDNNDYSQKINIEYKKKRFSEEDNEEADPVRVIAKIDESKGLLFIKSLYVNMKKEIDEKTEKIHTASYQIGKLEAEMKQMISLADHNKQEHIHQSEKEILAKKVSELFDEKQKLETKIKGEKMNKIIAIALFAFLVLSIPSVALLISFGIL